MFIDSVAGFIRRHHLIRPGQRILVACSGGADSTALAVVLHRLAAGFPFTLEILHVHHGLRGDEADRDEAFCRELAAGLGRPFHRAALEVADPSRPNLEEWLREGRHARFQEFRSRGFDRIALGHTRDDQAETVLMRLCRGAGPEGLAGMAPGTRAGLIRPLLACSRHEVLEFLAAAGVAHREDASNADPAHLRNRIRHRVLPVLTAETHPAAARVIARSADVVRRERAALAALLRPVRDGMLRPLPGGGAEFPVDGLLGLPPAVRLPLLRELIREVRGDLRRLSLEHLERVLELIAAGRGGRRIVLPGGLAVRLAGDRVCLGFEAPPVPPWEYRVSVPGRVAIAETGERFEIRFSRDEATPEGEWRRLPDPGPELVFRSIRPGDRVPMAGGRKKVKKLLQERRIPPPQRGRVTVVVDAAGNIQWIPALGWGVCYNEGVAADRAILITRHQE